MSERVLFVDDEPNLLDGIRRQLRGKLDIETAPGPAEGLKVIEEKGPFAVVGSDMRMPQMNGTQFLTRVRQIQPDTVRMILSGQSDLDATIAAVNEGHIFRFLTKPCPADALLATVRAGIEQYRLVHAEKELLENTLSGIVKMLTEILGLTNPAAYSRAARVQRYAEAVAAALGVQIDWSLRLATMLSQLGCITLPAEILAKVYGAEPLSAEEQRVYDSHPELAARLLSSIPRLERVAATIATQCRTFDCQGLGELPAQWEPQRLGAFVLHCATRLDQLIAGGSKPAVALQKLTESWPGLPAGIGQSLRRAQLVAGEAAVRNVRLAELMPGMVLDEDLRSSAGLRLVPKGQEVTNTLLVRLRSIASGIGIIEPFRVKVAV
jgi:CheY-like chemotaxis protein